MSTTLSDPTILHWISLLSMVFSYISLVPLHNPCLGFMFLSSIKGIPAFRLIMCSGKPFGCSVLRYSVLNLNTSLGPHLDWHHRQYSVSTCQMLPALHHHWISPAYSQSIEVSRNVSTDETYLQWLIVCALLAPFTTGRHCLKSPARSNVLPPKGFFCSPIRSLNDRSRASSRSLSSIVASSDKFALVSFILLLSQSVHN